MTRTLLAALAGVLMVAAAAPGQPPADGPVRIIPAEGTEVFRWLLHKRGVKPLKAADISERLDTGRLGKVIVVALGRPEVPVNGRAAAGWGGLAIRSGGAALIATDTAYEFWGPYSTPPANADTTQYVVLRNRFRNDVPDSAYGGHEDCPFAAPRNPPFPGAGPEWDLFAGLKRVATNRPGHIPLRFPNGEFRSVLAGFPPQTRLEVGQGKTIDETNPHYTLAVGGSGPYPGTRRRYRFLAIADPEVFTNEMIVPPPDIRPSDNLEFAQRVVSFLVEEGGVDQRKECLFVHNGRVVERFDTLGPFLRSPTPLPNVPPFDQLQPKLVDAGNEIVDKLQDNDFIGRLVASGSEERQRQIVRGAAEVLLALAAVWAVFLVGRRVWGARQPADVPPPPPGGRPVVRDGDRRAGVFDRRQKELLRRDDLSEPARAAVRELFREAGAPADPGPRLPRVRVSKEVGRPDTLLAALRDLWAVGYGRPARLPARRWAELEPLFVRARRAHADGKWAFADSVSG